MTVTQLGAMLMLKPDEKASASLAPHLPRSVQSRHHRCCRSHYPKSCKHHRGRRLLPRPDAHAVDGIVIVVIAAVDGVIGLVMRATRIVWKVGPREKVRSEVQIQIEPSNQGGG